MLLKPYRVVDMSDFPLELVAEHAEIIRLSSWQAYQCRHPDLWHDGRWIEPERQIQVSTVGALYASQGDVVMIKDDTYEIVAV